MYSRNVKWCSEEGKVSEKRSGSKLKKKLKANCKAVFRQKPKGYPVPDMDKTNMI